MMRAVTIFIKRRGKDLPRLRVRVRVRVRVRSRRRHGSGGDIVRRCRVILAFHYGHVNIPVAVQ